MNVPTLTNGGLTWEDSTKINTLLQRDHCHGPASGNVRLHTRKDPALSVWAGGGVFWHLIQGAPGGGPRTWEQANAPVGGGELVIRAVIGLNR